MLPCKNFAPSWLVNESLHPEDYTGQVMAMAQDVGYLTAEACTTTTSGRLPRRVRARNLLAALYVVAGVSIGSTTAGATDTILVMNSSAASLSVLDMATRKEIRRIPVLREPHHWALTPDRKDLLVGDTVANELLFLDPVTFEIKRRLTMSDPYQLGFSPDGKFFVVAAIARNQIDIYEPVTYRLIKRFNIKSMPSHIDFMPDSSVVFVSLQGTGQVVAIDLRTMLVLWDCAERQGAGGHHGPERPGSSRQHGRRRRSGHGPEGRSRHAANPYWQGRTHIVSVTRSKDGLGHQPAGSLFGRRPGCQNSGADKALSIAWRPR